tara:strand:+ start:335 stop:499 length:165 start_codon:yes stop_codon:yes gene_type:complete
MSDADKKHDLSTLKQMKHLLDQVSMSCCDSAGVLDEIDEVINMMEEWIKELEDA